MRRATGAPRVDSHLALPRRRRDRPRCRSSAVRPQRRPALDDDRAYPLSRPATPRCRRRSRPIIVRADHSRPDRLCRGAGDRRPRHEGAGRHAGRSGACGRWRPAATSRSIAAAIRRGPQTVLARLPAAHRCGARAPRVRRGRWRRRGGDVGRAGLRRRGAGGRTRVGCSRDRHPRLAAARGRSRPSSRSPCTRRRTATRRWRWATTPRGGRGGCRSTRCAHVDRVGTILLPGFLLIMQLLTIHRVAFMFGWAKPVPVAAWKFRNPRRGMMVVAAAGPAMNFLLAWIGALGLHVVPLARRDAAAGRVRCCCSCSTSCSTNLVLGAVQPAADPAARRRADRGRPAAAAARAALGAAGAGRDRAGDPGGVPRRRPSCDSAGFDFDPIRALFDTVAVPRASP